VALEGTNVKFEKRFAAMERALDAQKQSLEAATLEKMENAWQAAKRRE
jgi:ATP diphosphatase